MTSSNTSLPAAVNHHMDNNCVEALERLIAAALREDLGDLGDITTQATIPEKQSKAGIIAKSDGIVCGTEAVRLAFARLDRAVQVEFSCKDGEAAARGKIIAELVGSAESLLTGERVALNFLQRLSGIATLTSRFVKQVAGYPGTVLDTRKTTPGWRPLEKYAVRCGGGSNHRLGLFDMFLIKENHIAAAGGIEVAVQRCRDYAGRLNRKILIEVETRTLEEVEQAIRAKADRIMLDNMNLGQIKAAVDAVDHRIPLEASGNVNLETIAGIAATGVEFISTGAITHSAPAMDFSMLIDGVSATEDRESRMEDRRWMIDGIGF